MTAQEQIKHLFNRTVTNSNLVYDFNLFDASVTQKLWSTDYYLRALLNLDISEVAASSTAYTGSGIDTGTSNILDSFCRENNRLLDGFFMNAMSTLDTLGHQIYILYTSQSTPPRIYLNTAKDMLVREHQQSILGQFLNTQLAMRWFFDFEPFRHCTTHESLIRFDDIQISYDYVNSRYKLSKKIKLPDNPQVRPYTYQMNRVVNDFCKSTFRNLDRLVKRSYECIRRDVRQSGNVIPIP
jgi:hypothetical protein